ncbi:tryptophan--tRNA ligase [Halocalculus aciditolerans]|uniref:Tryptophan--tRNA ligase n=1 Tax=Halocalculus aciditolerans TaxID=1383812 RepID=A0A830F3C3_9EURY|nr:tryptophan--tRNA ligase [Halocalculus aciditolerans]GGL58902.1 tryptophan--tRNA ligase [Halocalculus aciditolerans]
MPTPTDTDSTDSDSPDADYTVTPYDVEGDIDYAHLVESFGADALTDAQVRAFPVDHPLVRRRIFYAGRDIDAFTAAARADETHSLVTGRGPSGPMHLGNVLPFYFAKAVQDATGAHVYIPFSDDEKHLLKDQSLESIAGHTRENLRDVLAVGFDPAKTKVVVDTADADVVYPLAAAFSKAITQSTVDATYGDPETVGLSFYPAVQTAHLLLPQLVHGRHATLVPIAVDQDPHVRVSRDVAAKARYEVNKPGALLSEFLSSLDGPGKMSSSSDAPSIGLSDDPDTVREKLHQHAYSGGRSSLEEHREHGGDPSVDVAFQYLRFFFEPDDDRLRDLAAGYEAGDLLSGELKDAAADRISDFLERHQERRAALGDLGDELDAYRLTDGERDAALSRAGYPMDAVVRG